MSTLFLTDIHDTQSQRATLSPTVPKRPQVRAPKFGSWLELRRGDRSFEQIAQKLRPLVDGVGLKVDRSAIKKLEQGRVPNWPMIGALSQVYDVPAMEVVRVLINALEFPAAPDLFRDVGVRNVLDEEGTAQPVQPASLPLGLPVHDESRSVPAFAAAFTAAIGDAHALVGEAHTLVNALRTAASEIIRESREQAPDSRPTASRKLKNPRKRR